VVTYRTRSRWLQTNETDFAKAVAGKYNEELLEPRPKLLWEGALALLTLVGLYFAFAQMVRRRLQQKPNNPQS